MGNGKGACFTYEFNEYQCWLYPKGIVKVEPKIDFKCYIKKGAGTGDVIPMACKPLDAPDEAMCVTDKIDLVLK